MMDDDDILDGLEAIAGFMRRSVTTVLRWADESGDDPLPIRRLKSASGATMATIAYRSEIRAWLRRRARMVGTE